MPASRRTARPVAKPSNEHLQFSRSLRNDGEVKKKATRPAWSVRRPDVPLEGTAETSPSSTAPGPRTAQQHTTTTTTRPSPTRRPRNVSRASIITKPTTSTAHHHHHHHTLAETNAIANATNATNSLTNNNTLFDLEQVKPPSLVGCSPADALQTSDLEAIATLFDGVKRVSVPLNLSNKQSVRAKACDLKAFGDSAREVIRELKQGSIVTPVQVAWAKQQMLWSCWRAAAAHAALLQPEFGTMLTKLIAAQQAIVADLVVVASASPPKSVPVCSSPVAPPVTARRSPRLRQSLAVPSAPPALPGLSPIPSSTSMLSETRFHSSMSPDSRLSPEPSLKASPIPPASAPSVADCSFPTFRASLSPSASSHPRSPSSVSSYPPLTILKTRPTRASRLSSSPFLMTSLSFQSLPSPSTDLAPSFTSGSSCGFSRKLTPGSAASVSAASSSSSPSAASVSCTSASSLMPGKSPDPKQLSPLSAIFKTFTLDSPASTLERLNECARRPDNSTAAPPSSAPLNSPSPPTPSPKTSATPRSSATPKLSRPSVTAGTPSESSVKPPEHTPKRTPKFSKTPNTSKPSQPPKPSKTPNTSAKPAQAPSLSSPQTPGLSNPKPSRAPNPSPKPPQIPNALAKPSEIVHDAATPKPTPSSPRTATAQGARYHTASSSNRKPASPSASHQPGQTPKPPASSPSPFVARKCRLPSLPMESPQVEQAKWSPLPLMTPMHHHHPSHEPHQHHPPHEPHLPALPEQPPAEAPKPIFNRRRINRR